MSSSSSRSQNLLLGCYYRPPSSLRKDIVDFEESLESSFNRINTNMYSVVLVGDFKATSPSWLSSDNYNCAGSHLEYFFNHLALEQRVNLPTHLWPDGTSGGLLDLLLVSNPSLAPTISSLPPVGKSDHVLLTITLAIKTKLNRFTKIRARLIWFYDRADFTAVNNLLLSMDWSDIDSEPNIDDAWSI